MTFGFVPRPSAGSPSRTERVLALDEWFAAGIPLLRNPRELVGGLSSRHRPTPTTAVVGVLTTEGRLAASASFGGRRTGVADGWECRNAILTGLRRVIPHDLRRPVPVLTAVLLVCRNGEGGWTREDGAWMWGLRDACTLHGLRCGAYITLTASGWRVMGDDRAGRRPSTLSRENGTATKAERPRRTGPDSGAGTGLSQPSAV